MPKQKVTLSLDTDIYRRTRLALDVIPGKPSVSALVDELLDTFVSTVLEPMSKQLGSGVDIKDFFKAWHADALTTVSLEYADLVRTLDEQEVKKQTAKK